MSNSPRATIWMGNITETLDEASINSIFTDCPPASIRIIAQNQQAVKAGKHGFAFLIFSNVDEAGRCLALYNGRCVTVTNRLGEPEKVNLLMSFSRTTHRAICAAEEALATDGSPRLQRSFSFAADDDVVTSLPPSPSAARSATPGSSRAPADAVGVLTTLGVPWMTAERITQAAVQAGASPVIFAAALDHAFAVGAGAGGAIGAGGADHHPALTLPSYHPPHHHPWTSQPSQFNRSADARLAWGMPAVPAPWGVEMPAENAGVLSEYALPQPAW